jgi:hypothetical protein
LGQYKELGSDHLDIQSDGYFEATAKKEAGKGNEVYFDAKPTSKVMSIKSKDGQTVNLTMTDPVTGESKSVQITVMPKVQQKGRRGAGGGGGVIN